MTNKAKHTPGPWEIREQEGNNSTFLDGEIQITTESDTLICALQDETGEDWTAADMNANARLISAAPDLLAALERVLECHRLKISLDTNAAALEQARAAIAKAKGE